MKLYFLFLYAGGGASSPKMKYLDGILEKEELFKPTRQTFQEFCEATAHRMPELSAMLDEIDRLLGKKESWNREQQIHTLWTLINLGHTEGGYFEAEQAVVDHLARRWEIAPALLDEFTGIAAALQALDRQKQWVQSSEKPPEEIERIVEELDRSVASMFDQVQVSISEVNIT